MIKRSFENIKYGSYPQNADLDNLHIEYIKRLFTEQPIDCLTNNKVERLKVSLIRRSLDNRRYESNNKNSDFDDLPFDVDKMLITRQQLNRKNDDIIFRQINSLRVYV